MIRAILVGAALLTSAHLLAQQEQWRKEALENCEKNQLTMNVCAVEHFKDADNELNALFLEKMKTLTTKEGKQYLQSAQRAWISFRDKDCLYQAGPKEGSGSIWALEQYSCLKYHTDRRIQDIKRYLECTQNGCPH
jgi:uncharacterized protein YecT (DUF1311 family)